MKRIRRAAWSALLIFATLTPLAGAAHAAGKVKPDNPDAQLEFGIRMARRGLWSEALFRFKQAEKTDPNNPRLLNNMAVAYEAIGQFELALEYYQRALKVSSSNAELRRNYSRFVEFYRNFRAETGGDEEDGEAEAGETAEEGEEGGG